MRALLLASVAIVTASSAVAQRPSTLAMSCDQAQGLVAERGAVVMSTGRNTYKRFVASAGYCVLGEFAYRVSAPTRDARRCSLGYECRADTPLFQDGFDIPGR